MKTIILKYLFLIFSLLVTSSYAADYCYSWDCDSNIKGSSGEQTKTKPQTKYGDESSEVNKYGKESYKLNYGDEMFTRKSGSTPRSNKNKRKNKREK